MINASTEICYSATCDTCGKEWEDEFKGWSLCFEKSTLEEHLLLDEWLTTHDGKCYCAQCYKTMVNELFIS